MALGQNTVIETIIGRYKDEASKQITKSFKDLAKITLGPFLAIRTIENSFRAIADYAREHYTTSRDIVLELDKSSDRTLAIVSNSEAFKAAMGGAVFVLEQINELLGDITDKTIKEAEMRLNITETAAEFATEQVDITKLTGEQREDFFHMQRFYSDLVVKAKEEVKELKEKKKILDESMIEVKPKPIKIDDALKASEDVLTMNVVAIQEAQNLSTMLVDIKTQEIDSKLDQERRYQIAAAQLIEEEFQLRMAKAQATSQILGNLASAAEVFGKKGFAAAKAASMAQAIVDTYAAANVALRSAPPPFNYGLAASVVAAGLANVAKIASTNYGSKGSGGSSSSGISSRRDFGSQSQESGPTNIVNLRLQIGEQVGLAIKEAVEKGLSKDIKLERLAF